jgi:hypothetical protein
LVVSGMEHSLVAVGFAAGPEPSWPQTRLRTTILRIS